MRALSAQRSGAACLWLLIAAALLCSGCRPSQEHGVRERSAEREQQEVVYARKFSLSWQSGYRVVRVMSPDHWLDHTYILVPEQMPLPNNSNGATVLRIPLKSVTCENGFQVSLLDMLGAFGAIRGVSGKTRIGHEQVHEKIDSGELAVTGFMRSMNMETLLKLDPDLAFVNVSSVSSDVFEKMSAYGLSTGYFCASIEEHPLGTLEWIKFMGAFFQQDSLAAALFREREQAYLELQQKTVNIEEKPAVIAGYSRKGAWSTMGSSRWFATMLEHAGASYLYEGLGLERGHILSNEVAMNAGIRAKYWVNTHFRVRDLDALLGMDRRYGLFTSVRQKTVYNNNHSLFSNGRSRFWDVGMTEPHVILADLIRIFHPDLLPDHDLVYYHRLLYNDAR